MLSDKLPPERPRSRAHGKPTRSSSWSIQCPSSAFSADPLGVLLRARAAFASGQALGSIPKQGGPSGPAGVWFVGLRKESGALGIIPRLCNASCQRDPPLWQVCHDRSGSRAGTKKARDVESKRRSNSPRCPCNRWLTTFQQADDHDGQ